MYRTCSVPTRIEYLVSLNTAVGSSLSSTSYPRPTDAPPPPSWRLLLTPSSLNKPSFTLYLPHLLYPLYPPYLPRQCFTPTSLTAVLRSTILYVHVAHGKACRSNPPIPVPPAHRSPPRAPRRAAVGSGLALAAHVTFSERARRQVERIVDPGLLRFTFSPPVLRCLIC